MLKDLTFEEAMAKEIDYQKAEYAAIEKRDYSAADFFHEMRWRCLAVAMRVIAS